MDRFSLFLAFNLVFINDKFAAKIDSAPLMHFHIDLDKEFRQPKQMNDVFEVDLCVQVISGQVQFLSLFLLAFEPRVVFEAAEITTEPLPAH